MINPFFQSSGPMSFLKSRMDVMVGPGAGSTGFTSCRSKSEGIPIALTLSSPDQLRPAI